MFKTLLIILIGIFVTILTINIVAIIFYPLLMINNDIFEVFILISIFLISFSHILFNTSLMMYIIDNKYSNTELNNLKKLFLFVVKGHITVFINLINFKITLLPPDYFKKELKF